MGDLNLLRSVMGNEQAFEHLLAGSEYQPLDIHCEPQAAIDIYYEPGMATRLFIVK